MERHNYYILFIQGFVESSMQFYCFFLTPIKIATKYRVTQEITPAATVIATVMTLEYIVSSAILEIVHKKIDERDSPYLLEILPVILYFIAATFIYTSVREEITEQRKSTSERIDESLPM